MKLKRIIQGLLVLTGFVLGLVFCTFVYERYQEDRWRESIPAVTPDPDWKPWMYSLALKIHEDPDYGAIENPDISEMILIPEGEAWVGCKEECNQPYATLQKRVFVGSFLIDKNLVAIEQYNRCIEKKMCLPTMPAPPDEKPPTENMPVLVDYDRAERYCRWAKKRLPAEFEWEKAARGTDGSNHPWGESPVNEERANFCDVNCSMTWAVKEANDRYAYRSPVGAYPNGASPYGVLDMAGNLKQWVSGDSPNPVAEHIAKGSSWYSAPTQLRSYIRQDWKGGIRLDDKGVRCALSLPPHEKKADEKSTK